MRLERAISRDALAKKAGTSRECVRKLEAGVSDLTVGTLHRLATPRRAVNGSIGKITGGIHG